MIQEIKLRYFKVNPKDIAYLKAVLEGYEGAAVVRTLEGNRDIIEILIAHDLQAMVAEIIASFQNELSMEEIFSPPTRSEFDCQTSP